MRGLAILNWANTVRLILSGWYRAALHHAALIKKRQTLPLWVPLLLVLVDFGLVAAWYHLSREFPVAAWAISDLILYLARLALVSIALRLSCSRCQVTPETLGIIPSRLVPDLRWAIKCCFLGSSVIGAVIALGFLAAQALGIHPPPPPEIATELLGGSDWGARRLATLAILGFTGVILAPFTEELIYRSALLPPLTSRLGLYSAIPLTGVVFGLVHVVPLGELAIPAPQILGGLMMAVAFSIRWSVIPSIVLHSLGNLFAGLLCLAYVRLYEACPTLFSGR